MRWWKHPKNVLCEWLIDIVTLGLQIASWILKIVFINISFNNFCFFVVLPSVKSKRDEPVTVLKEPSVVGKINVEHHNFIGSANMFNGEYFFVRVTPN